MRLVGSFFTHDAQDAPFWWDSAPPVASVGVAPAVTEIAIVGGDATGLSAALTLGRAGRDVTVFEADIPGWAASSRSAGMPGPGWTTFDAAMATGSERARAIIEERVQACDFTATLIRRESIACDLAETGLFRGAATPRIYEAMGRELDRLARIVPIDAHLVPRAQQRAEVGTDFYHGGIAVPGCAGPHPARYVAGLAAAAGWAGARMVSGARVSDLRPETGGFVVTTPGGETRARRVLVASDGAARELVPYLRRRLAPIRSAMIATERLPQSVVARLMPKRRMVVGTQRLPTYFRSSPDGRRILFGGRMLKPGEGDVARTNAFHLRRQMLRIFPELEQNLVSHYWHCETLITFDSLPHLGKLDGLFYACGTCQAGVTHATWLGHTIARRMLGDESDPGAFEGLLLGAPLISRLAPWFRPVAMLVAELMDRWDAR